MSTSSNANTAHTHPVKGSTASNGGQAHTHDVDMSAYDKAIADLQARVTALEKPTTPPPAVVDLRHGLIGNDGKHLAEEKAAGITTKLFELSWASHQPSETTWSASYISSKQQELSALRQAGFNVILGVGSHYEPSWLWAKPNAQYVNQYGDTYTSGGGGDERVDYVFNTAMRTYLQTYLDRIFADFGTDFAGVRVGMGHYGELSFPDRNWNGKGNCYWAYNAAATGNPAPGWKPGQVSPNGEAGKFVNWYLDALTAFSTWQIQTVRAKYTGPIHLMLPSWGVRAGQLPGAVAGNLAGTTSVEQNGELQRGYDHSRHVAAVTDPAVWIYCTWLEAQGADAPAGWLAGLAKGHNPPLKSYGENAGQDSATDMQWTQAQVTKYGLEGFLWFSEPEMYSGQYATLADYTALIAANS